MKLTHLLAVVALAVGPVLLRAQTDNATTLNDLDLLSNPEAAALTDRLSQLSQRPGGATNTDVFISQVGSGSVAFVDAQNASATPSMITIDQGSAAAIGNEATLFIVGGDNNYGLLQDGSYNSYTGNIVADGATLRVLQQGDNNVLSQSVTLDPGATVNLNQLNGDNTLDASGVSRSITVTQYGGASATLRDIVPN